MSQLNLTAFLLMRFPAETGEPYLDPMAALEAFLTDLPISAAEARQVLPHWTELDIAGIKRLRQLKNRISPMLLMRKHLPEGAIGEWAELHPRLP
ncbi:MAG TPA: hypothetical protein VJ914_26740 [Pseudonocardiaceae bacterium]|nr:hypothetical protein [Pseudonocardiaceae bacterium]